MRFIFATFYLLIILGSNTTLLAQQYALEQVNSNSSRNQQLLGNVDSNISFSVRTVGKLPKKEYG